MLQERERAIAQEVHVVVVAERARVEGICHHCAQHALPDQQWRQEELEDCKPTSVAVSAEIPLRSPQKIITFIINKIICWVEVSKNKII